LTDFGCYGVNLMTYLMHGWRPTPVTAITQHLQPQDYPKMIVTKILDAAKKSAEFGKTIRF